MFQYIEAWLQYTQSLHGSLEVPAWLLMFSCPNSWWDVGFLLLTHWCNQSKQKYNHARLLSECPYKWMTPPQSYCFTCLTRINVRVILKLYNFNSNRGGRLDCKQIFMMVSNKYYLYVSEKVGVSEWTFISYNRRRISFIVSITSLDTRS